MELVDQSSSYSRHVILITAVIVCAHFLLPSAVMLVFASVDTQAMELASVNEQATDPVQVTTLNSIKMAYNLQLDWKGDPCYPTPWQELNCSFDTPFSVISLNLSDVGLVGPFYPAFGELLTLATLDLHSNRLTGPVPSNLAALWKLEFLNLSDNNLTGNVPDLQPLQNLEILNLKDNQFMGQIPEGLGKLPQLQFLNLENNNLSGVIPPSLVKQNLQLLVSGNPCLGFPSSECNSSKTPYQSSGAPQHSKRTIINIVYGLASGLIVLILVVAFIVYLRRRHMQKKNAEDSIPSLPYKTPRSSHEAWSKAKQFSWNQMNLATNHFTKEIGKGSFGPVYFGRLPSGQEVAVKVRSDESKLGADSFDNEVHLLSKVHHVNLVSLVGYCQKAKQQLLVYEYMPNGTLQDHLYGQLSKERKPLSWKTRLHIAVGSATGLEYLHNHSTPKIIHRDVKSSNILLDASMNAKVADFGFSKHIKNLNVSHVTTVVKGTAGYLDPEYYATNQLTEKSDVYSLGVVLLELICGREPLSHWVRPEEYNLIGWARPLLRAGTFDEVVDKSLFGTFNAESMCIVGNLAARCTERMRAARPTMEEVLKELKMALSLEVASSSS